MTDDIGPITVVRMALERGDNPPAEAVAELLRGFDEYVLQAQIDGSDAYDPDYDVAAEKKRLWG